MSEEVFSDKERDTALDALAIVRLALQQEPGDEADTEEKLQYLVGDRDDNEKIELMFRIADLTAVVIDGWHKTMMMVVPVEHQDEVLSPEGLLNQLVEALVNGPPDGDD